MVFIVKSLFVFRSIKCYSKYASCKAMFWLNQCIKIRNNIALLWTIPFLSSTSEEIKSGMFIPKHVEQKRELKLALVEADELFESNKYQETVTALMPYKESGDVDVLWRLSRAYYILAVVATEPKKRQLICEAYSSILEALALDDSHWAVHKWMSVLLDAQTSYDGVKARVTQLERIKHHMVRAAELNPRDATTLYMLGSWCYQIADMTWVQRKIASTIFAAPPLSSFEEALYFFSKAEEVQPKFYSQNLLMIGKTLLKLQRIEEAVYYFVQAKDYPSTSEEDDAVKKEAIEILKTLKVT